MTRKAKGKNLPRKAKGKKPPLRGFAYPRVRGLTLRDYLATQALYGVLGKDKLLGHPLDSYGPGQVAEIAYIYADAMLRARK